MSATAMKVDGDNFKDAFRPDEQWMRTSVSLT
jgi:hypothetical protein